MNKEFLLFFRAGVSGYVKYSHDFTRTNWKEIEDLAVKQNVLPLVFDGYQLYYERCGLQAPIEVKLRWYAATQQAEKHYNKHLNTIRNLASYFNKYGIKTMVLKGYSLSLNYVKPQHRACGDIDIYQFGELIRADKLVENELGIDVDRKHHNHTVYEWDGVTIENHYDFINCYSHVLNKRLNDYLVRYVSEEEPVVDGNIYLPSANFAAVFTLVHSAAHFASINIELRRFSDWWLLKKKIGLSVDWVQVEKILEECGFLKFYDILNEISDALFGEEDEIKLSPNADKVLTEVISQSFKKRMPNNSIKVLLFKFSRWWANRWKMKIVYSKENLFVQFLIHTRSNFMNNESRIK